MILLQIVCKTVAIFLDLLIFAMFFRALLPFFTDVEESNTYAFLCTLTEPFIIPVRAILAHFNVGQDSPLDMAFTLTYFLLVSVQIFLPVI